MSLSARFILFTLLVIMQQAVAYPEYSARYNVISCTACHLSPVGGGPRTLYGKLFAAHGYKINPVLEQDYVSADFRALYYYSQRVRESKGGMGVMSGSIAGHVPLDEDKKIHLVIEHNIGGFAAAPYRDTYALFKLAQDGHMAWLESILVGRFRAPFGLTTDEHRTYTRVQTATEWYTFETGMLFSGAAASEVHYDLAVVNGENSAGQSLPQGEAVRWGSIANVRWMPGSLMLGASGSYHDHTPASESRKAASLYAVWSVARWTNDRIPIELNFEHARAWGWDSNLGQGFANDPAYVRALGGAESYGYLVWLDWTLRSHLVLTYKFDYLTPNKNYPADSYQRHGLGLRYYAGPGVILQLRTEVAQATPPSEMSSTATAAQNATYGLLQVSF